MNQQIELAAPIGTKQLDSPTEAVAGRTSYTDVLAALHGTLRPRLYFEIGVRFGRSISLATSDAIGVDPNFAISVQLSAPTRIYKMTSDDFFRDHASEILRTPIDLAFIDGQHWFEFALRDFLNIERHASPFSVVAFDDIFPNHPIQAARERQTSHWTGDVWKIVPCLRRFRPDLTLVQLDTSPTGLLLVLNLSPGNTVLSDRYDEIVRTYNTSPELSPGKEVLARVDAVDPTNAVIFAAVEQLRRARECGALSVAQQAVQHLAANISDLPSTAEPTVVPLAALPRTRMAGPINIVEDKSPAVEHVADAVYLPPGAHVPNGGFGLFRSDGTAVPASIYTRSQNERPFNQPDRVDLPKIDFDRLDGLCYFIGPLVTHYGHFTIETVSRLWAFASLAMKCPTVVYHGIGVAETFARFPFVKSVLGALGIDERNLRRIERPTLLSEVVVAEAAIQPRRCVFADIIGLYEEVARALLNGIEIKSAGEAVYLSKGGAATGVGKILNEFEVEDVLEREGVHIVRPEHLDIVEQIRIVNGYERICGTAGSALHTTLFALNRKRIVYLVPQARVNSNFVNLDICKKHDSSFVFCPSIEAKHSAFLTSYRIEKPSRVAELILRELEAAR